MKTIETFQLVRYVSWICMRSTGSLSVLVVGTSNPSLVSHQIDDTHRLDPSWHLMSLHKTFGETLGLDRGRVETTTTETWYQWGSWATKNVPKLVVGWFLDVFFFMGPSLCGNEQLVYKLLGCGNSNIFYFHPYLGKIPILTNIFQMGWNHQLELVYKSCW